MSTTGTKGFDGMKFAPLGLLVALALAGCQEKSAAPAEANPDARPGLTLSDGQLILPAVSGNPGAAYFTLTNGSNEAVTLAAASIDGAEKAEMHEMAAGSMGPLSAVMLKSGETVKFARGGKHVMVFGLAGSVTAGGKTEMTLTFADGDKLSAPLEVVAPGQMPMDHGDSH
jgi:periplasmic copper chaperone A